MSMLPKVREIRRTLSSSAGEESARRIARMSSTLWGGGLAIALVCGGAVIIGGARNSGKADDADQVGYPGSVSMMTFWGGIMRDVCYWVFVPGV